MSEWQPIETAPKDEIILIIVNGEVSVGGITDKPRRYFYGDKNDRECSGAYDMLDVGYDGEPSCCVATHWMPLPQPPK